MRLDLQLNNTGIIHLHLSFSPVLQHLQSYCSFLPEYIWTKYFLFVIFLKYVAWSFRVIFNVNSSVLLFFIKIIKDLK